MDAHLRQQFDLLLLTAVDRFAERLEQRNAGGERAVEKLRTDPNGEGVWLDEFVDAVWGDFVLDTPEGAAWVLTALAKRPMPSPPAGDGPIGRQLDRLARKAFAALLAERTIEALESRAAYGVAGGSG